MRKDGRRKEMLFFFFLSVLSVPLEGLKSQGAFEEMRQSYIRELTKAIHGREKGLVASSQRFYHLTKLMDAMHEVSAAIIHVLKSGCGFNENQAKHECLLSRR